MRIAIVNDQLLAVEVLKRVLSSAPNLRLSWVAMDGDEAVQMALKEPPDILLMDLVMPSKNGLETTKEIMAKSPCAILIVSACIESCMNMVFETMGAGALDVVSTPELTDKNEIKGAVELIDKINAIGQLIHKLQYKPTFQPSRQKPPTRIYPKLLLLGASTGGPIAIAQILSLIPKPFNFTVVIIQHVDMEFLPGLIQWLIDKTGCNVLLAEEGRSPFGGNVYLANTNKNLTIGANFTFSYIMPNPNSTYTPSIDHFFESAATYWTEPGVAALLTGMGSDGAVGLLALKNRGWLTLAQEEKSCVVYGMPRKAVELHAASRIASLEEIPIIVKNFYPAKK